MKRLFAWFCLLSVCGRAFGGAADPSEALAEGRRIAERVRELQLTETAQGTLTLYTNRGRTKLAEIPFALANTLTTSNWATVYATRTTNDFYAATLTVIHAPGQPNEYRLCGADTNIVVTLNAEQTMTPFARSDYWVADLGLEFLHWPGQRLLSNHVHRSQSCHKLESTNPSPGTNGYTRVISWIDIDTGGIVEAEAYVGSEKLKIFEPTDVQKVNGRYQIRTLEIENRRARTKTVLTFDYDRK